MVTNRLNLIIISYELSPIGGLNKGNDLLRSVRRERINPVDARIAAKPAHLFARQTLCFLRNFRESFVFADLTAQVSLNLRVANRLVSGHTQAALQTANLINEASLTHLLRAQRDALIQLLAAQIKPDLDGGDDVTVARKRGGERLLGNLDDF